jgi:plasmid maintenance system antidote protein VapI
MAQSRSSAGRQTMGRLRLPPEVWAKVEREMAANPDATQQALARIIGVSRSTVGRVVRARRVAAASAE